MAAAYGRRRRHGAPELYVSGLSSFRVSSAEEAVRLVDRGLKQRTVRGTRSNDQSSRSHAVLQVSVEAPLGGGDAGGPMKRAKLYLVDLAGSEKASALEAKDAERPAKDVAKGDGAQPRAKRVNPTLSARAKRAQASQPPPNLVFALSIQAAHSMPIVRHSDHPAEVALPTQG